MVNPVQNQGQCGSCWAFASTATIESAYAIAGNPLTKLSEQQFVNCDTGANGCDGGNFPPAFNYAKTTKILKETQLPYTGVEATCTQSTMDMAAQDGVVMLSGY
jgi:C1A family cysteine protease